MSSIRIERTGGTYVACDGDRVVWTIELPIATEASSFHDETVWPAADVVAIGGGHVVHFVAIASGARVTTLELEGDWFGHFGEDLDDALYILGWRHVVAVDRTLAVRWISRDVAVDGITWRDRVGDRLLLSAEMDPPGGWVDVELDAATGRELARASPRDALR